MLWESCCQVNESGIDSNVLLGVLDHFPALSVGAFPLHTRNHCFISSWWSTVLINANISRRLASEEGSEIVGYIRFKQHGL